MERKPTDLYLHDRLLAATVLTLIPAGLKPNHLTIFRLLITPLVAWLIYFERLTWGIPLFILVAFTDALDGSLARVRGQVTEWGTIWDPVADKVLIGSTAVILLIHHFPPELAMAIFGLEALFIVGAYFRKRQGRIVSANKWGKIKMLLQVIGIAVYMLSLLLGSVLLADVSFVVLGWAVVFAIISLFNHGF